MLFKRNSSLRSRTATQTLKLAKAWVNKAGISRVSNITQQDKLGMPVYYALRPDATSNPVTYGKGLLAVDAQVGAYMEAIEYYYAEPNHSSAKAFWGKPQQIVNAAKYPDSILDFPPKAGCSIKLDQDILLVEAEDIDSNEKVLLPAELVFNPAPNTGQSIFGSSSNGLASGNNVLEASIHALNELIERDIWSFQCFHDTSTRINPESLPKHILNSVLKWQQQNLEIIIRHVNNEYNMAFFIVYLIDTEHLKRRSFNGGWGCHMDASVSLGRAISEAAQSRVAFLHGARALDDSACNPSKQEQQHLYDQMCNLRDHGDIIDFSQIKLDQPITLGNQSEQWQQLRLRLNQTLKQQTPIYRVQFTNNHDDLQVVKLIVPHLEHFTQQTMRVGRRLSAAIETQTD